MVPLQGCYGFCSLGDEPKGGCQVIKHVRGRGKINCIQKVKNYQSQTTLSKPTSHEKGVQCTFFNRPRN